MVLAARCGQATSALLRQRCLPETRPTAARALRTFTSQTASTRSTASCLRAQQQLKIASPLRSQQLRSFSSTLRQLSSETINPPSATSYLSSGAVKPKDLVDVKKVLVIGSGGISIGQAGEFDYSGK